MGIKVYNPYTPSRRQMTGSDFAEITKTTPEKSLTESLKKNAGRNNQGKITVRHRGGGTESSILSVIRMASLLRLSESSTILTEQQTSLLSATQTARRHTFLHLPASK